MKIKILNQLFIRHNHIDNSKQSIWFLHGFADSGLAYKKVFEHHIQNDFNIYIADLPGYGVSPLNPDCLSIKEQADLLTKIISEETLQQDQVNIVAHSLGALIGTWVCQNLAERINYFINIEGNLTESDSYFSGQPLKFETAAEFIDSFKDEIFELAKSEERFKRYYSSLSFANPEALRNWSISSQEYIKDNKSAHEFKNLSCKKLYIWGDVDTQKLLKILLKPIKYPIGYIQVLGIGICWKMRLIFIQIYMIFYVIYRSCHSHLKYAEIY